MHEKNHWTIFKTMLLNYANLFQRLDGICIYLLLQCIISLICSRNLEKSYCIKSKGTILNWTPVISDLSNDPALKTITHQWLIQVHKQLWETFVAQYNTVFFLFLFIYLFIFTNHHCSTTLLCWLDAPQKPCCFGNDNIKWQITLNLPSVQRLQITEKH